jgi:hypothetical protein
MSDKQQDTRVRAVLILVIIVLAGGIIWYVGRAKDDTDKTIDDTRRVQQSDDSAAKKQDEFKGMKSYNWEAQKVSLKYPEGWTVEENTGLSRLYLKNKDVDLLKEETPADFQQVWLSYDVDETTKAREDAIKQGTSNFRVVNGDVKASTVKADGVTINVYEYETLGGPTLEAYWTNSKNIRFLATTSTEVGEKNQKDMVANLKKVLASLKFD